MSIIGKLYDKVKLFIREGVDLNDIRLDAMSYAVNFSRNQRCRRRKLFSIEKLICGPITGDDRATYRRFLSRHSLWFRKSIDEEYFSELIRTLSSERLYHVARFEREIIGSVRMHCTCTMEGMRFWFISEVYVLREFHGKGIGERLIRSIIARASGTGDVLYLTVNRQHFKAANLYKKIGFHESKDLRKIVIRELYDPTEADTGMALFLFKRVV